MIMLTSANELMEKLTYSIHFIQALSLTLVFFFFRKFEKRRKKMLLWIDYITEDTFIVYIVSYFVVINYSVT